MKLVVVGLGYVGLPLAVEASRAGIEVSGLDINADVVSGLASGRSHIEDISPGDVAEALAAGFIPTTDPDVIGEADTIVITVPTPLTDHLPDLSAVEAAGVSIGKRLQAGDLVVLESTSYPGTTEEVLQPILEEHSGLVAGRDFHLAFSPERIDPGNPKFGLRNTPKVVGGIDVASTAAAAALYERICDSVVAVSGTREAEMAKLLENTYRHINIALVNEMAIFSREMDIDLWEAIRAAATKPFGFQAFYPGPGVGGHCIPIDPAYLSARVRDLGYPFRFVELAQEVNNRMPAYVVARAAELLNAYHKPVNGSLVLLLGITYKADVADTRETPARAIAHRFMELGAQVTYADPHVDSFDVHGRELKGVMDAAEAAAVSDLTVLLANHAAFDLNAISERAQLLLDTRGVFTGPNVERL
jgi:nucleotide sugar dehydrogenase